MCTPYPEFVLTGVICIEKALKGTEIMYVLTSEKYTAAIKFCTKGKTAQSFADAHFPLPLRQPFIDIFNAITCGLPGHSERNMCPLAPSPDKFQAFAQSARTPSLNSNK